jgi:hypothetical protein
MAAEDIPRAAVGIGIAVEPAGGVPCDCVWHSRRFAIPILTIISRHGGFTVCVNDTLTALCRFNILLLFIAFMCVNGTAMSSCETTPNIRQEKPAT